MTITGTDGVYRSLVKQVIYHEEFRREVKIVNGQREVTLHNDVALLQLDPPILFTEDAQSICLPQPVQELPGKYHH